jgi:hypothetical protein
MPVLNIPIRKIQLSGLPPVYYMGLVLQAKGAPVEVVGMEVKNTGKIIQQDDASKQNIIYSWEDK